MKLTEAEKGVWLKIVDYCDGMGIVARLQAMGFVKNKKIKLVSAGTTGPLLIAIEHKQLMLGRGLAEKITVAYCHAPN